MKQLPLHNTSFQDLQTAFTDWLSVLGYSDSSVKALPLHLRELLYFLEQTQVTRIQQVGRVQVRDFFTYLSGRGNLRNGDRLSSSYLAK